MNENSTSILVKNVTVSYRNGYKALWNASLKFLMVQLQLVGVNGGKINTFQSDYGIFFGSFNKNK